MRRLALEIYQRRNLMDSLKEFLSKLKWGYIALGLLAFMVTCGSYFTVDAGEVGVTFNTISGKTQSYSQGFHFKTPFVTSVTSFDVKTQREDIKASSASKDLQKVNIHIVLNYHLQYDKVDKLYVRVGSDYVKKIIVPAVNELAKASTAKFEVENIIVKRDDVRSLIEDRLITRLAEYDIIVESVDLVDIDFDEKFNAVVEEKQMEQQKVMTAEYVRQQAETKKKTTILEAEAEAAKQRLLSQTVTRDVIALKLIEKWDGKYPQVMSGNGSNLLIQPNLSTGQ